MAVIPENEKVIKLDQDDDEGWVDTHHGVGECYSRDHPFQGFIQDFLLGRGKKDHTRLLMPTLNTLVMHIVIEGPDLKEVKFNPVQRSEPS